MAGFEKIIIQVLDKDDYAVAGKTFEVNASEGGAVSAKISGLGATSNVTNASNVQFHVSSVGTSSPKLELTIADLAGVEGCLETVAGLEKDADGTIAWSSQTRPPFVAVILKSHDKDGNELYIAMLKGKLTMDGIDFETRGDKGEELVPETLSGDFISRKSDEKVTLKHKILMDSADKAEDLATFKGKAFQAKPAG